MSKRQPIPKRKPIVVKVDFMPSAELAKMLGISPSHAKWLDQLLEENRRKETLRLAKKRAALKGPNGRNQAGGR
jgi:hypothetical protein